MFIMKLKILFFLLLCVFAKSTAQIGINHGWSFYQEDGKWGVLYEGEPCLLPRFDGVSGDIEKGKFVYKEKNKYGISTVWKKVTEAFCDSLVLIHNKYNPTSSIVFCMFKKDGKWGICRTDGTTILAPTYNKIDNSFYDFRIFRIYPSKYQKKPLPGCILYFLVNDGTSNKMIDVLGNTIITNIGNFEDLICSNDKEIKAMIKAAKKKEWSRNDKAEIDKIKAIRVKTDSANAATSLFGDYKIWDNIFYNYTERCKDMQKPRKLYFGPITEAFGDTAIINGYESIVNSYGFISTPLTYDSPYFKLQNNPADVMSLLYILELDKIDNYFSRLGKGKIFISDEDVRNGNVKNNIIHMEKRLIDYQNLINIAKNQNDTLAYNIVMKKYDEMKTDLDDLNLAYGKGLKHINAIDKIDNFANTATSILNSVANAIGETTTGTTSYRSTVTGKSSPSKNPVIRGSQMSMSDQVNYNSLRNTYNKWAIDLMQMKNANGKYQNGFKITDKKHAQDEMKRIRKSAMQKWNKEIPYNSIEDW